MTGIPTARSHADEDRTRRPLGIGSEVQPLNALVAGRSPREVVQGPREAQAGKLHRPRRATARGGRAVDRFSPGGARPDIGPVGEPEPIYPRTGETDSVSHLASATARLVASACSGGRDAVERDLLREVVQSGLASAAGIWSRPHPMAAWAQVRSFGGDVPAPSSVSAGCTATRLDLWPDRCLVALGSLLNHEANVEAIELLASAVVLTCPSEDEAPPPLPAEDRD